MRHYYRNECRGLDTDWHQTSGDVTAARHGAIFTQIDAIGERVYGVRVLEIVDLLSAVGERDARQMGGELLATYSYVDPDEVTLDKIKQYLASVGEWREELAYLRKDVPEYAPDEVNERLEHLRARHTDLRKLHEWNWACGIRVSPEQRERDLRPIEREVTLLVLWYSIERTRRAEIMAEYGGFTDSNQVFRALSDAMAAYDIPREALWDQRQYDAAAELDWSEPLAD